MIELVIVCNIVVEFMIVCNIMVEITMDSVKNCDRDVDSV